MAGSKREFLYQTDGGTRFAIIADESNTEDINFTDAAAATLGVIILPVAKYCRRARYASDDKLHSAMIPVLTPAGLATLPPFIDVNKANGAGGTLTVRLKYRQKYAEKFKAGSSGDTGSTLR